MSISWHVCIYLNLLLLCPALATTILKKEVRELQPFTRKLCYNNIRYLCMKGWDLPGPTTPSGTMLIFSQHETGQHMINIVLRKTRKRRVQYNESLYYFVSNADLGLRHAQELFLHNFSQDYCFHQNANLVLSWLLGPLLRITCAWWHRHILTFL